MHIEFRERAPAPMMPATDSTAAPGDDIEWAERSEFWLKTAPSRARRIRNHPDRHPLILNGHGVRLRIDHGTLLVQDGFTHYPQRREEFRLFPGDWRLPSRIVVLDGSGSLTFDVLSWLSETNIPLVQIDWRGEVVHFVGGSGYAIDPKLAQAQLAARQNGRWLILSRRLVSEKIANSIKTLRNVFPKAGATDEAIVKLNSLAREMKHDAPTTVDDLRGVEGRAATAYFAAWHAFPLRWKGTERHAIPDDWRRIGRRISMASDGRHFRNRNATHPVNAMLNYTYGALENNVRMQIVGAGLDPTIGYLHGDFRGSHGLVYDLMEPLRPVVDRGVLEFVQRHTFEPGDFTLTSAGVCRLNPQLARCVIGLAKINISTAPGMHYLFKKHAD
jgi:CRISP-associated protein Cas1